MNCLVRFWVANAGCKRWYYGDVLAREYIHIFQYSLIPNNKVSRRFEVLNPKLGLEIYKAAGLWCGGFVDFGKLRSSCICVLRSKVMKIMKGGWCLGELLPE